MHSLKSFDIRLTDIWIECKKELIEMRDKILNLNECLKTSEAINRHLNRCNESLVAIIEKCELNYNRNKDIVVLINAIKEEEKCIERENQIMKTFKDKTKHEFNEHKVSELIVNWNQCKPLRHLIGFETTIDRIFTPIDTKFDENDNRFRINGELDSLEDLKHDFQNSLDLKESIELEIECKSDVLSNSEHFSQFSDNYESDSDSELSSKRCRKKNKSKVLVEKSKRVKRLDELVVPFKVDNNYICSQSDCRFTSSNKRNFSKHLKSHEMTEKSEKQKRIDALVLNFKVDDQYNCNEKDCQFKSCNKTIFYKHMRDHKPLRERWKVVATSDNPKPFLCDWPGCDARFKQNNYLRKHRFQKHLDVKPFMCDWPGCEFKMYDKHHCKLHRMTHTKEKPLKCDWPGCEFRCSAQWSLVTHKRKHTGEKPYECPWPDCNYRCSQPCTLISHKRKHTGEKPYICEVIECRKRFSSLAGIHMHRKKHNKPIGHKRKPRNSSTNTSIELTKMNIVQI